MLIHNLTTHYQIKNIREIAAKNTKRRAVARLDTSITGAEQEYCCSAPDSIQIEQYYRI